MKKVLLVLLLMVGLQTTQAQVAIGGMAGINYSKEQVSYDVPLLDTYFKAMDIGYFIGLNSSFVLGEKFNFLGDLKYAGRGYKYPNPDVNGSRRFRVNYFELAPKFEFRPSVNIGFALGVNFGIYGGGESKRGKESWQKFTEEMDSYTSNFALTGSVRGYIKNFFIEIGYEHGIKNVSNLIFDGPDPFFQGDYRVDLRNFNLGVGYLFAL